MLDIHATFCYSRAFGLFFELNQNISLFCSVQEMRALLCFVSQKPDGIVRPVKNCPI